jgi:hypothetical protein
MRTKKLIPAKNQGIKRSRAIEHKKAAVDESAEGAAFLTIENQMRAIRFLDTECNVFAVGAEGEPASGGVAISFGAVNHGELLIAAAADESDTLPVRAKDRRLKYLIECGGSLAVGDDERLPAQHRGERRA